MATNPKKPKQYVANHYVSQCYLRGFIDPTAKKEKVWAYGCYKGAAEATVNLMRISQTALVNNLYGVDDTERAELEAQFKIVEDLFPPIRAKLNSHGELSKIEVGILTIMFFLHMARNPSWAADNLAYAETIRSSFLDCSLWIPAARANCWRMLTRNGEPTTAGTNFSPSFQSTRR